MGGMIGEKEKLGISDSIHSIIFNFATAPFLFSKYMINMI